MYVQPCGRLGALGRAVVRRGAGPDPAARPHFRAKGLDMSRQDYSHKARKKTRRKKPVTADPVMAWARSLMASKDEFVRYLGKFLAEEVSSGQQVHIDKPSS